MLDMSFQAQGDQSLLKEMRTEGRSVATMSAPKSRANDPRAASKRLTADAIKMGWRVNGKDLEKAEAVGNAELYVEPLQKSAKSDRKTLTAPRFDCDFFESGNITPQLHCDRWRQGSVRSVSAERKARCAHDDRAENGRGFCARDSGRRAS